MFIIASILLQSPLLSTSHNKSTRDFKNQSQTSLKQTIVLPVFLAHKEIVEIVGPQEVIIIQYLNGCHPLDVTIPGYFFKGILQRSVAQQGNGLHEISNKDEVALTFEIEGKDVVEMTAL